MKVQNGFLQTQCEYISTDEHELQQQHFTVVDGRIVKGGEGRWWQLFFDLWVKNFQGLRFFKTFFVTPSKFLAMRLVEEGFHNKLAKYDFVHP